MMISNFYKNASINQIQVALSIIGLIVASWIMFIQQGWVNDDSVIYFETARLFSVGEWRSAVDLFPWPFYPLLITTVHYITALDFHLSAQILNAALLALTINSLLRIIILAGGDKLSLLLATLLLFSTTYIVGDVLPMLLRDQGFWAFLLSAMVFLIKFYRQHNIKDALYWQLLALTALLFRTETITYIALLPLALLFKPNVTISIRARSFLLAYAFYIVLASLALIAVLLHGSLGLHDLIQVKDTFLNMAKVHDFSVEITAKAHAMATAVLGEPLAGFAWLGLTLTLISIAVVKCMTVAGITPLFLTVLNYNSIKLNMAQDVRRIILVAAFIAFANAILILLQVNILSKRYVIFFGLMLLILATFSARALYERWQLKQLSKIEILVAILAIALIALGSVLNCLPKDAGYNYEQQAVSYIKTEQTKSLGNSKVFYSSPRTRYYGGDEYIGRGYDHWDFTQQAINDGTIYQYDFLAINLNVNDQSAEREKILAEKLPQYVLVKTFYGYKMKKRVLVYKKVH
jgi:hypothetical protein